MPKPDPAIVIDSPWAIVPDTPVIDTAIYSLLR